MILNAHLLIAILWTFLAVVLGDERANRDTDGLVFSEKHERLISSLRDYHIVRPKRCSPDCDWGTYDLSTQFEEDQFEFHRVRRRSRRDVGNDEDYDEGVQKVFHFSMNAFGTKITINVTRSTGLTSPTFKVHRHFSDGSVVTERPRMNCFYRGNVLGANNSAVAVSNCKGMSGWIKTDDDEYFIEPLEVDEVRSETYNFSEGFVHIMYRRRDVIAQARNDFEGDTPPPLGLVDFSQDIMPLPGRRPRVGREANYFKQRAKRQSTRRRHHFVETMATVDDSLRSFHGDENVVKYVITIFNIVNMVYTHPSLEAHIEFVLTRMNILDGDQSANLVLANQSVDSLANTCRFARVERGRQIKDDGSEDYFDHSVFFTRISFGPAGYAPVGTMCDVTYSCSLVKEDGLQMSFVLAHEAGHVLGMEHDGDGNTCFDDAHGMSIMATVVQSTPRDHYWSECSRNELHATLGDMTCLWDEPTGGTRATSIERPGQIYTMDEQCRFQFGEGYRKCHHTDVDYCVELYCTGPDLDGGCLKKGPPMDGSSCGPQRECVRERCVRVTIVHGGWSEWTPWGECSFSCGLGVQLRTRRCNNPKPQNGGRDCVGDAEEIRLCNTEVCPDGPTDKHLAQCIRHSKRTSGETLLAYPNTDPRATCKLSCISESSGEVYVSDSYVIDGTPVSHDYPEYICVNGEVVNIGCDVQLGSTKMWDNCGVCDGRNATCYDVVNNIADKKPKQKKYKKLMTLSPGMWNLQVTKLVPSSHFLALKIEETGKYILNRGKQQSHSHAFIESGVRFVYNTDGEYEMLTAKGPIPFTLLLMAFAARDTRPMNYSVEYYEDFGPVIAEEAGIQTDTLIAGQSEEEQTEVTQAPAATQAPDPEYSWDDMGWTDCNRECGGGYSFHRFQCTRIEDNRRVNNKRCGKKNYDRKVCEEHVTSIRALPNL
ncbi:A disintegrin and metalloproteinase with thrombospondin motifs 3-like [Diadema antillarum]|uniref:A disintegrin and metalloproteinase with thrombospondin motifs 3-like n=1 Tax=Diadema antillarum TaxID=105358 RepID=UPI003A8693E3